MKWCLLWLGVLLLSLTSFSRSEQGGNPLGSGDSLGSDFISYDTPPAPLEAPAPDYPEAARKAGIQGKVFVKMRLDLDGSVMEARVTKSSGNADLDQAAVQGAKKYKFTPALNEGKPVRVWVTLPFSFSLKGKYTLSVLGFRPVGVPPELTAALADTLVAMLAKFDGETWFSLSTGIVREKLLGDSAYQRKELYDSPQLLGKFGKAMGVDMVLGGKVFQSGKWCGLAFNLINVSSAGVEQKYYEEFVGKPVAAGFSLPSLAFDILCKGPDSKTYSIPDTIFFNTLHPDANRISTSDNKIPYDTPPRPLETPHPNYPFEAKMEGRQGRVIVQILLDKDGSILQAKIRQSSGRIDLDRAAAEGAMEFKFSPAKQRGKPVQVWVAMPIVFKLHQ